LLKRGASGRSLLNQLVEPADWAAMEFRDLVPEHRG
jgi:hypothetical protein